MNVPNSDMLQQHQVQVAGTPIMVNGLKGEYHVRRHMLKQQECPFDAGFDLYASRVEPEMVRYFDCTMFILHTDINLTPSPGVVGMITERSSTIDKLCGGRVRTGIIDPGYIGEILFEVVCSTKSESEILVAIKSMQSQEKALAQILFLPFFMPVFVQFDQRNADLMKRGSKGFGHTDILGV
jgi:dUTPase